MFLERLKEPQCQLLAAEKYWFLPFPEGAPWEPPFSQLMVGVSISDALESLY